MVDALHGNEKVAFFAIQTVFEGGNTNTYERMIEIQAQYGLKIPFGHDAVTDSGQETSQTMIDYRTGGTPWFIFIDEQNQLVFNDFHLDTEKAISFLRSIE